MKAKNPSEANNTPEVSTTEVSTQRVSAKDRFKAHVKEQGGSAFMSLETEQWRLELQMLNKYLNAKFYRQGLQSEQAMNAIDSEMKKKKANDFVAIEMEKFYALYPEVEVENRKIDYPFLKEVVFVVTSDFDEEKDEFVNGEEDIPTKVLERYIALEEEKREKLRINNRNKYAQEQSPTSQSVPKYKASGMMKDSEKSVM
jgi:hypothetical protein